MRTQDIISKVDQYGAHNYHPLPIAIKEAKGGTVTDVEGKRYIDCLAAYSAMNLGHNHPRIISAATKQLSRVSVTSRAFHHDLMGDFLELACTTFKQDRALPMNSGAEAVETAVKLARKWAYEVRGVESDRAEIIVFENNFHGRTTTIVSFSSEPEYKRNFGPLTPGFKILPYGDLAAVKAAINKNTAAVLIEPIQGEAGILIPPVGFLKGLQDVCKSQNVLLMLDEIQTGLGRTGKMGAYEHEGLAKPDVLILGKALGGGIYPVSLVLARNEVMGVLKPGHHGSTFGGNALACAIGIEALKVILDEKLCERSAGMGEYMMGELRKIESSHIAELRGRGLMIGVEIKASSGKARPFCEKMAELGVLCKETHDQVIRFTPPLVIDRPDIDFVVKTLRAVLNA